LLLAAAFLAGPALAQGPPRKPQRVASINLSADEVLVAILPLERPRLGHALGRRPGTSNVVGRVPPAVHRFVKADMEQLVALRPDLVVVSEYTDADFMKQLERSGLRVHRMLGLNTLAGVRGAILDLGRAVGEDEAARRLVAEYDAKLAELGRRLAGAKQAARDLLVRAT
jgi:iron complex transport system substrate-binding protein